MQAPDDGHVLLLMEFAEERRTFTDYPNVISCLDNIIEFYEQSRVAGNSNYNLDQLCEWIQGFKRFSLFIYNKEIARYKELDHSEMRERFVAQLERLK